MPTAVIVLYALLPITLIGALLRPWIGVLAYYTLSLWYPQMIWYWAFGNMRIVFYVSIITIFSFAKAFMTGRIDLSILRDKQNFYILMLWASLALSNYFNPYGTFAGYGPMFDGTYLLSTFSNIFLIYFISILLIDDKEKMHYLILVFILTTVYYVYWGNHKYFSGGMTLPRLQGPGPEALDSTGHGIGPYTDENNFAMLFVMGTPFLFFMGKYYQNRILRYFLWMLIPLAWHVVFLTSSLGGLIGLSVVTLYIAVRSRKKIFMMAIPLALLIAFISQGGPYLQQRIERQQEMNPYDNPAESTATQRLNAWEAGMKMLIENPFTGVGLGNFFLVYHRYSDTTPHVAHNTFFQFAAEAGIFAGLAYLLIFGNLLTAFLRQKRLKPEEIDPLYICARDAISGGALGYFVCASFLNLGNYEVIYYLLILNVVQKRLVARELQKKEMRELIPAQG